MLWNLYLLHILLITKNKKKNTFHDIPLKVMYWYQQISSRKSPFESTQEILALFILRKFILQIHMRSHPVGLDVWFLVRSFVYFHTSCVWTAKALARLRGCGRLCDKYHNLMSWLISLQPTPSHGITQCTTVVTVSPLQWSVIILFVFYQIYM